MKNLKNYLKNGRRLVALCAVFFSINVLGMFIKTEKGPLVGRGMQQEMQRQRRTNQYFLYGKDDPNNGIWVDKEFIKANCEALRDMIADFGETQEVKIPIGLFPIAVIKLGFDVLANKVNTLNLSLTELIDVANIFNFLGAPADKMKSVLERIVDRFSKISDEELNKLNPDVQKLLMTDPTISYLKDRIIKKYAEGRKQVLVGHPRSVCAVAFSSDGKKIVSGCGGNQNNLIVWDISNPNNITHKVLMTNQDNIYSVAFSPDGKYIVSSSGGNQNNFIICDITDPNHIIHQVGPQNSVMSVAWSPDGKHIVSGSSGSQNNLIVWDMSNLNNIIPQVLVGHENGVNSVAWSSDGKHIVSGGAGFPKNLILWDITDPHNITHQALKGHRDIVSAVTFSPDGKKIASGAFSFGGDLSIWNISDPHNITHQTFGGLSGEVNSIAFSADGKRMVSGSAGKQNNLIIWDVSNPRNITYQIVAGCSNYVNSVAFSFDGKIMVSGIGGNQNNLILWILLTDQEEALLKQLTDYSADQIGLIYRLCRKASIGQAIKLSSEQQMVFMTLPQDMQKLLRDLF